jgi:hypothetical protein
MSACETISSYLDGRLEAAAAERFEEHLEDCVACRRSVEAWRAIAARIVDVSSADSAATAPTTHEQLLIVQRAELERGGPRVGAVRIALAASVLLALGVIVGYFLAGSRAPQLTGRDPGAAADQGLVYRTDARSRTSVQLRADTIHLGPASRVRVLDSGPKTRLALEQGSLACEVAARVDGGGFSVEAPGFSVRVTGTRFLVDLGSGSNPALVVVSQGTVEVRGNAGASRLRSGQRMELEADAAVRPASAAELAEIDQLFGGPAPDREAVASADDAPGPDAGPARAPADSTAVGAPAPEPDAVGTTPLARWRGWVIEGRLDEARSALRSHLAAHPSDADAWSLLADCERKRASWEDAVAAYDSLVSCSSGEQASRARFRAAQLLQDRLGDHRRAAELLERFVEAGGGGSLLVDKARIRLARSLAALGRRDRARSQLSQVIESSTDGETVATARQMLEQLDLE